MDALSQIANGFSSVFVLVSSFWEKLMSNGLIYFAVGLSAIGIALDFFLKKNKDDKE